MRSEPSPSKVRRKPEVIEDAGARARAPDVAAGPPVPLRNPMRLPLTEDEPPFRRHDCRSYQRCLDTACAGRWESWSCTGCYAFEPATRAETSTNRGRDFIY